MEYAPGTHSHNLRRTAPVIVVGPGPLRRVRLLLLVLGFSCLSYYCYSLADEYIYQSYENWAFDQQIAGRFPVNFAGFVRSRLGLPSNSQITLGSMAATSTNSVASPRLAEGDLVGRITISRLNLSAIVREGVSDSTLKTAVGHVPSTALPGQQGNFAIAAHRDTLFRALKDIHLNDVVDFQSPTGTYAYLVKATKIVKPTDVSILRADAGGLIQSSSNPAPKLLTMITCYPFSYVGSAPKRFIVEAELAPPQAEAPQMPANLPAHVTSAPQPVKAAQHRWPRATHSNLVRRSPALSSSNSRPQPVRKPSMWYRLTHRLEGVYKNLQMAH